MAKQNRAEDLAQVLYLLGLNKAWSCPFPILPAKHPGRDVNIGETMQIVAPLRSYAPFGNKIRGEGVKYWRKRAGGSELELKSKILLGGAPVMTQSTSKHTCVP